ncbi:tyrosine-type recombinase/integrase [Nocardiopsis ganjiahuensis]|uniref:tyrosine-type recombinase/integrase n=1 Tax=Nocardiopsis ganjiahuensis TaxID=239984 RepID=UPI0003463649|nr:tyrosine-type recombinase/integrase [Nocardiopsis ganjiahuensis]
MAYAEPRGNRQWRARYTKADGTRASRDRHPDTGEYFTSRRAAEAWGDAEEARIAAGLRPATLESGKSQTFGQWVNTWYVQQDLAPSTMSAYRTNIEARLLPYFEDVPLAEITSARVTDWERRLKAEGLSSETIRTYRGVLSVILADAAQEGLITANPVYRPKGRGKRAGKSKHRGPEKAIASPFEALMVAERAAALSGRADEFVQTILIAYAGLRWGETVGLQRQYVRMARLRVEHQVYELPDATFVLCPPKEDSYRDVDLPAFLTDLLSEHMVRRRSSPTILLEDGTEVCACARPGSDTQPHPGGAFVFTGRPTKRAAPGKARKKGEDPGERMTPHWRRSGFASFVFTPATEGFYPPKAPLPRRPVPVSGEAVPGEPVRGRGYQGRADRKWDPVVPDLTPHGLRHSHKTWLVEDGVPEVLSHERLGHEMGGIAARYTHITQEMRDRMLAGLTARWEGALQARFEMDPNSSVPIVDGLLAPLREEAARTEVAQKSPQNPPNTKGRPLRRRPLRVS